MISATGFCHDLLRSSSGRFCCARQAKTDHLALVIIVIM